MTALFEFPVPSETLTAEELAQISGCARRRDQIAWLEQNHWTHLLNRAGEPIVGRLYARLRLSGISPESIVEFGTPTKPEPAWAPDFSKIRGRGTL